MFLTMFQEIGLRDHFRGVSMEEKFGWRNKAERQFVQNGYVIQDVEDSAALEKIRAEVVRLSCEFLKIDIPGDEQSFLDNIKDVVEIERLNEFRLYIIQGMQSKTWFREAYFACASKTIQDIVGNDLAMQRNMGLSIQIPRDTSSILPLHSDVWGSECSAFESVVWLPLVDCYRTKSMFVLPPEKDFIWREKVVEYRDSSEKLFHAIEPHVEWLDVKFGQIVVFTPTVMHGNRLNEEETARWTFNIRFKGLYTPYADKRLGEYFLPMRIRPLSEVAMRFKLPGGFSE